MELAGKDTQRSCTWIVSNGIQNGDAEIADIAGLDISRWVCESELGNRVAELAAG